MALEPYTKHHLSYEEQVKRLAQRGLQIRDPVAAAGFLRQVSYYRFSAYRIPFQKQPDFFLPGTTFEHLTSLYQLDEALRQSFVHALSPVEVCFRTRITYKLTEQFGPFAHYDLSLFRKTFNHDKWKESLEGETIRAHETFVEHFKATYANFPQLPLWMAVEVMSFGSLSKLYGGLLPDPQRSISEFLEVHHSVLHNWLHALTYIRNVCAHHNRLWNRELAIRPDIPRREPAWQKVALDNSRVFAVAAVLEWITRKAKLPIAGAEQVYTVMDQISREDERFKVYMGVPRETPTGPLWGYPLSESHASLR